MVFAGAIAMQHAPSSHFDRLPRSHRGNHLLAYRVSTALFGRRFYFTILSGTETRAPARLARDGHAMSLWAFLFRIVFVCGWVTLAALTVAVAGAILIYMVKSYLGIDLMHGPSFLHAYFY
jgi:hypothetical protein